MTAAPHPPTKAVYLTAAEVRHLLGVVNAPNAEPTPLPEEEDRRLLNKLFGLKYAFEGHAR